MYGLFCYVGGLKLLLPLSSTQYACGGRRHDDAFLTQMASAKVKAHVWWHLWHSGFAIEKQKTRTLYSFLTNDPSWRQKKKWERWKKWSSDHSSMLGCCVWRMASNPTRMSEGCQKYYRRIYVLVKQSIMCLTHVVFFSRTFFHLWLRLENEC